MSYRIMMKFHLLQNLNPCCKKIFNSKKGETQTLIFFVIYSVEKIKSCWTRCMQTKHFRVRNDGVKAVITREKQN